MNIKKLAAPAIIGGFIVAAGAFAFATDGISPASADANLPALCEDQYRTATDGNGETVYQYPVYGDSSNGFVNCYWDNGMVLHLVVDDNGQPVGNYWSTVDEIPSQAQAPVEDPDDGKPADQEPVDGKPVDGEPVDGKPVDQEPVDGSQDPLDSAPASLPNLCAEQYRTTSDENGNLFYEFPVSGTQSDGLVTCTFDNGMTLYMETDENGMIVSFYWEEEPLDVNPYLPDEDGALGIPGSGYEDPLDLAPAELPALCAQQYRVTYGDNSDIFYEFPVSGSVSGNLVTCTFADGTVQYIETDENGSPISIWEEQPHDTAPYFNEDLPEDGGYEEDYGDPGYGYEDPFDSAPAGLPARCVEQYRTSYTNGGTVYEFPVSGTESGNLVRCTFADGAVLNMEVDENGMPISAWYE